MNIDKYLEDREIKNIIYVTSNNPKYNIKEEDMYTLHISDSNKHTFPAELLVKIKEIKNNNIPEAIVISYRDNNTGIKSPCKNSMIVEFSEIKLQSYKEIRPF